jgi:hypothetical protein
MQDFDSGAFDKTQLDQPPLKFGGGKAMVIALDPNRPDPAGHSDGGRTKRYGVMRFASSNASALSHR